MGRLKKLLKGLLLLTGVLLLLFVIGVGVAANYLYTHQKTLIAEALQPLGLRAEYRSSDLTFWSTFPRFTLAVDSLVVRDTILATTAPPLIDLEHLTASISLAAVRRDTVKFEHVRLAGGSIYVASDSTGRFNLGSLTDKKESTPDTSSSSFLPVLDWEGGTVALEDLQLTFLHPSRYKRMATHVDSLTAVASRTVAGEIELETQLAMVVEDLAFNTRKGSYLRNAPVSGPLTARLDKDWWIFEPTSLQIGGQTFSASARIARREGEHSRILLTNLATEYAATRALLPEDLREKLQPYRVDGTFPVTAEITGTLARGEDPVVKLDFSLAGQDVKLKQYFFTNVSTSGTLVNQLAPEERPHPDPKKNLRISLARTTANHGGMRLSTPWSITRVAGRDTRLEAPMRISGPAAAVSRFIGARDFFLDRGSFVLDTEVDASLASEPELISATDFRIRFAEVDVNYAPAEVTFPFAAIDVRKEGPDIRYDLRSAPLPSGFFFQLTGQVDNLTPLLIDQPGEAVFADALLTAPRIDWEDFRAFFGENGYFAQDTTGGAAGAKTVPEAGEEDYQITSMKRALLGIQQAFHPTVEARFDTVSYYDIFSLANFTTGLRFGGDTLVLERTSFAWEDAAVAFGARVKMGQPARSPFDLDVRADNLNLNRLRPTLDYFGLKLPTELDILPADLGIEFSHRGEIVDTGGLATGTNFGELTFSDGRDSLFDGHLIYGQEANGLRSHLQLRGDPQVVNTLFSAENFFFGSGHFFIDLTVDGTPANLRRLIDNSELHLRINESRIRYEPAAASIPVRHFSVDVVDGKADYWLQLLTDDTNNTIDLRGGLDRLAAFLYPKPEDTFNVRTKATARALHWKDLKAFVSTDSSDQVTDTSSLDVQQLLSAATGAFRTFQPDLSLRIDTFYLSDRNSVTDLHTGLFLRDSTTLVLEKSGFNVGNGKVRFAGTYGLDHRGVSPFATNWEVDGLQLQRIFRKMDRLDLIEEAEGGTLSGQLTMHGSLVGLIDEAAGELVADSVFGYLDYQLTGLEVKDTALLTRLGRRALMEKRFRGLRFAPLTGQLEITNGIINVPRTEIQSTALQLFIEGTYDLEEGPDFLVSLPLSNIGRGILRQPPAHTGYARAGWKVYLALLAGEDAAAPKMKLRLGRRKWFKLRGRLEEFKELKRYWKAERKRHKGN